MKTYYKNLFAKAETFNGRAELVASWFITTTLLSSIMQVVELYW